MSPTLHAFAVRCTLRNGAQFVVHTLAPSSSDAIVSMLDAYGDSLARVSARPV